MSRLSIIILGLTDNGQLEDTLVSVLTYRPEACEVIVVHRGPYDDPYELKNEVCFIEVPPSAGLAECANAGLAESQGDVVHLLHSGVEVEDGWTEIALNHFDDPRIGMVSPLVLDADEEGRVVTVGVQMGMGGSRRCCAAGLRIADRKLQKLRPAGPSKLGGFYRTSAAKSCGGFESTIGDVRVDVDLAMSIKGLKFDVVIDPSCRIHAHESDDQPAGAFAEGRYAERLVWRHAATVGWIKTLLLHPWFVAIEMITGLTSSTAYSRLLGRAIACLEVFSHRRHRQRVRDAKLESILARQSVDGETKRIDTIHTTRKRPTAPSTVDQHTS